MPAMLHRLADGAFSWTAAEPSSSRPGVTYARNGFVVLLPGAGARPGVVLVDPPTLTEEQCEHLERMGTPTHVLLTCEWHTRRAAWCRERWGCRVLMHPTEAARAAIPIDGPLADGEVLWDAVRIVALPDVYYPAEVALLVECARPTSFLIVGDVLSGGRAELGIPDGEVALHAPRFVADFAKARAAFRRLVDFGFDGIGFGHGTPLPVGGRAAVERCLCAEVAWLASGGREGTLDRLAEWHPSVLLDSYGRAAAERAKGIAALPYD